MRGAFITFEGGDGAGKSTQIAMLAEELRRAGHTVETTREPGGSPGAEAIRELLVRGDARRWSALSEALLIYAARADHLERMIVPARESGAIVLCDRFSDSTMAYQGIAGELGREIVDMLDRIVVGSNGPDLTFVLDLPVSISLARAEKRGGDWRFESKGLEFQDRVRQAFLAIAKRAPRRCVVIDAEAPKGEVLAVIRDTLKERLGISTSPQDRGSP